MAKKLDLEGAKIALAGFEFETSLSQPFEHFNKVPEMLLKRSASNHKVINIH